MKEAHRCAPLRVALVATGLLTCAGPQAHADAGRTAELVSQVCQACHMPDGNSVVPLFPKLAGQHEDYLEEQLESWREGRRVIETMDPFRDRVRGRDIDDLAEYFAAQVPAPGTVRDPALAAAGRLLYLDGNEDTGVPGCEACHQWDGAGNERYPRLAGQHQDYTVKALGDFRSGVRRSDRGGLMNKIAGRMSDAEIAAVAEYIAGLSGAGEEE